LIQKLRQRHDLRSLDDLLALTTLLRKEQRLNPNVERLLKLGSLQRRSVDVHCEQVWLVWLSGAWAGLAPALVQKMNAYTRSRQLRANGPWRRWIG
jgi:hypothetical protein